MVKVRLDIGKSATESVSFFKKPQGHELYPTIVEEAQRGCDLHDKQAIEISFTYDYKDKFYTSYEFLFACVEKQEEEEQE